MIFYEGPCVFHVLSRSFFQDSEQWESAKMLMLKSAKTRSKKSNKLKKIP